MTEPAVSHPPCPVCGGAVIARRRLRAGDGGGPARVSLRCSAAGCHWRARMRQAPDDASRSGMQHAASPSRPVPAWRRRLHASGLLSLLALCVASPLAVVSLLGMSAVAGQPDAFGLAPGMHDDGRLVLDSPAAVVAGGAAPSADAVADASPAHGLQLRRGCRWGQPGRAPYRGSTQQALTAAGLPADVVAQIVAQQQAGRKSGRLAIARDGIRHTGDGRVFPAHGIALTFGMSLCQDASVNFPKGHVEMADLYEARDAEGRLHAVMVPDVCGNVSVLGAQGQQGVVAGMSASLARRAAALGALADALDPPADVAAARASPGAALATAPAPGAEPGATAAGVGAGSGGGATAVGSPTVGGPMDAADVGPGGGPGPLPGALSAAFPAGSSGNTDGRGSGTLPGVRAPVPVPLVAIGAVTGVLVPPQVAGGVVRQLGRVTASAGRGMESLAGGLRGGPPVTVAGGSGGSQPVPEPGSLATVLLALAALGVVRLAVRRR